MPILRRTVICTNPECPEVPRKGRPWVGQRAASKATDAPCPKCASSVCLVAESDLEAVAQEPKSEPKEPPKPKRLFMGVYRRELAVRPKGSTWVALDKLAHGAVGPEDVATKILDDWAERGETAVGVPRG